MAISNREEEIFEIVERIERSVLSPKEYILEFSKNKFHKIHGFGMIFVCYINVPIYSKWLQ